MTNMLIRAQEKHNIWKLEFTYEISYFCSTDNGNIYYKFALCKSISVVYFIYERCHFKIVVFFIELMREFYKIKLNYNLVTAKKHAYDIFSQQPINIE